MMGVLKKGNVSLASSNSHESMFSLFGPRRFMTTIKPKRQICPDLSSFLC